MEILKTFKQSYPAFVDKMSGCCGLSRIDVTNDDNVNVSLFFTHFTGDEKQKV